jgi:predicted nucleic acid-binding protein
MTVRSFIDTNVLIYADAADEPMKQAQAIAVIREHRLARTGVVSTQVLQEFAATALRKLRLPPELIRERMVFYSGFEVINAAVPLIMMALDLRMIYPLSFWDAMIVQAAREASCTILLSEDLQTDATISGVRIINPFL